MQSIYKPITFKPLTGLVDSRSNIDEVPVGSFRWKENFAINKDGKLARAKGWKRAFNYPCETNHDFHDQDVALDDREPMTLLFPSTAANGRRRLFGATKTRVLRLDEATGLWTALTGGPFGADSSDNLTQLRFNAAELKDVIYFTNNFDLVQQHDLTTNVIGPIADLATQLVTKARRVVSWNSTIILLGTVENGVDLPSRVRWSDLNNGLDWGTAVNSIANFQDLDYGHVCLNAVPIGSSLYIFTDRGIWRCNYVVDTSVVGGGDTTLDAVRVYYEPKNKWKCLAYPNSLISDGRTAYYLGSDDLYAYTPGYTAEPEAVEWIHRHTNTIFSGTRAIDPLSCQSPIAEAKPDLNEIHFSWPIFDLGVDVDVDPDCDNFTPTPPFPGTGVNSHTLVINTKYKTSDYRDYGSISMANFTTDFAGIGQCNQESALLSVNGTDWTIKQLEIGNGREMYDPDTGLYTLEGYFSILRGIFPFEKFLDEKEVRSFLAGADPENEVDTAILRLRLGTSEIALDPNKANGSCQVLWRQLKDEVIKCRYTRSLAKYASDNVKPNDPVQWNYLLRGRFLCYELTIAAADHSAPTTGGLSLSRFEVHARAI